MLNQTQITLLFRKSLSILCQKNRTPFRTPNRKPIQTLIRRRIASKHGVIMDWEAKIPDTKSETYEEKPTPIISQRINWMFNADHQYQAEAKRPEAI